MNRAQGISQPDQRSHNLALLASAIVHAHEPVTRSDLADNSGLTRPTVTRLVDQLLNYGICSQDASLPGNRGRPRVPLRAAARTYVAIGVEITDDCVSACVVDLSGQTVGETIHEMEPLTLGADRALIEVSGIINTLAFRSAHSDMHVVGVGIGVPGLVDAADGCVRLAPRLKWRDLDVKSKLALEGPAAEAHLYIGNEASLAAAGEAVVRRQQGLSGDFILVSGHEAIGAATVENGSVSGGRHGWAGELGHVKIGSGQQCSCGAVGCVEAVVGRAAIMRNAGLTPNTPMGVLYTALQRKEPKAVEAVRTAGLALGRALSSYLNVVDVTEVVFAGEFIPMWPYTGSYVTDEIARSALAASLSRVSLSTALGPRHLSAYGAAWWELDRLLAQPQLWISLDTHASWQANRARSTARLVPANALDN